MLCSECPIVKLCKDDEDAGCCFGQWNKYDLCLACSEAKYCEMQANAQEAVWITKEDDDNFQKDGNFRQIEDVLHKAVDKYFWDEEAGVGVVAILEES